MNKNANYAAVAAMAVIAILAAAYLLWTGPFSQPAQQNPIFQEGILQASPIILCSSSPDTSTPQICPRRSGTTISALTYATSIASNFTCLSGQFSGTCNTTVTNANGTVVLSGSSQGSSVCTDNRILCQVPLDAPNMPEGTYRVSFLVIDDNSRQTATASADVTVAR